MRPGGTNLLDSRGLRRCSQAPYPYDAYQRLILSEEALPGVIALLEAEGLCTRNEITELVEGTRLWAKAAGSFFARTWCEVVATVAA